MAATTENTATMDGDTTKNSADFNESFTSSTKMTSFLQNHVQLLDTVCSNFSDNTKTKRRRLVGLESPSKELYNVLKPCLVENNSKNNVAALVMGKRGSGKSLLVEQTLSALQQQVSKKFRVVRLNGLVIKGDDVGYAVKEIIRQLSDIAMMESNATSSSEHVLSASRQHKLRLRQSSFTSNLSLLDEALQMASVDGIPIVLVLDEFDALLGSSASLEPSLKLEGGVADRQLLLYHLLDRVTSSDTFLCLVAITSQLAAVSMLEKRVKSRAEGSCKVIFLNPYPTYDRVVDILLSKIQGGDEDDERDVEKLRGAVKSIISIPTDGTVIDEKEQRIQLIMERNFRLGKDMRWFSRVVYCALAVYREDCQSLLRRRQEQSTLPKLAQQHFLEALVSMNASFANETTSTVGDVAVDPRMQALMDLSGPQVALILAARRILARDAHTEDSASPKPLTFERMLQEYQSYRGPHRYHNGLLQTSFNHLLETDVLRPSADHTGGGPLQYGYSQSFYKMDANTKNRMPLHFPVDMDRELGEALKDNLLECSTSLREWGRRKN